MPSHQRLPEAYQFQQCVHTCGHFTNSHKKRYYFKPNMQHTICIQYMVIYHKLTRLSTWTEHMESVQGILLDTYSESLAVGSLLPGVNGNTLTDLETKMVQWNLNMKKLRCSDDNTTCQCTESIQPMENLLENFILPKSCSATYLMTFNDTAANCVT